MPASMPFLKVIAQVRIAVANNTAQYWSNLGSQQSTLLIGCNIKS